MQVHKEESEESSIGADKSMDNKKNLDQNEEDDGIHS